MPANLNALIRYKTINSCLYGATRKYDINELIEACSNALSESRGRYLKISERTVRDDIRVMRSEILGFNAPIEQKDGLYFYSNPKYTILSVGISDPAILDPVIKSLLKIRNEVKHPGLEIVLNKLRALSPESFKTEKTQIKVSEPKINHSYEIREIHETFENEEIRFRVHSRKLDTELNQLAQMSFWSEQLMDVSWGDLMKAI